MPLKPEDNEMGFFDKETDEEFINTLIANRAERWLVMFIVKRLSPPQAGMNFDQQIDVRKVLVDALLKARQLRLDAPFHEVNRAYDSALIILAEHPGTVDPDLLYASIKDAVDEHRRGDKPPPE
jgi:hypothetical protein